MSHDPLCVNNNGSCCPAVTNCTCQCLCDYIATIRADEREKFIPLTLDPGKTYVLEAPANTSPTDMEILRRQAAAVAPECKFIVLAGARIARAARGEDTSHDA